MNIFISYMLMFNNYQTFCWKSVFQVLNFFLYLIPLFKFILFAIFQYLLEVGWLILNSFLLIFKRVQFIFIVCNLHGSSCLLKQMCVCIEMIFGIWIVENGNLCFFAFWTFQRFFLLIQKKYIYTCFYVNLYIPNSSQTI